MDRVPNVPDPVWLVHEFYGKSGFGQRKALCMGGRTAQFKIMPLDYKETAVFHPNLSEEDNALIYGITGAFRIISTNWMFGTA